MLRTAIAIVVLLVPGFVACDGDEAATDTTDTVGDTNVEDTSGADSVEDTSGADSVEDTSGADTNVADAVEDVADTAQADTADTAGPSCVAHEPLCQDEQIAELALKTNVSSGKITEEGTTEGEFLTHIDATGGGMNPTQSYVYARFTATGLQAVAISDEDAFESDAWDISFRRYFIRLNGGVAGPSCVEGARTSPATTFETLTSVPAGLTFRQEQYYTADGCELVPDTSGLPGPQTVLSSFWSYPGCVKMTFNTYVIALADGRHVKFQVKSYYTPSVQDSCNDSGTLTTPSGAGNFRVRWAFLD